MQRPIGQGGSLGGSGVLSRAAARGLGAALLVLCAPGALVSTATSPASAQDGPDASDLERIAAWIEDQRLEPALAAIERALRTEESLGASQRSELWRLRSRALRYAGQARACETLEAAERALALARESASPLVLAAAHFDLGVLHLQRADPAQAEGALQAALELGRGEGPEGLRQAAQALVHLAVLAGDRSDGAARARALLDEARALQERVLEPDHPEVAFRLTREANLAYGQGELSRALELGQRALDVMRVRLRPDHPRVAMTLHNLGTYHVEARDLASAARFLGEALELRSADGTTTARTLASTRLSLAHVREELGDVESAEALIRAALEGLEGQVAKSDPYLRNALLALGAWALRAGDPGAARDPLERALASLAEDSHAPAPALAEARRLKGDLHLRMGEIGEARRAWQGALADLAAAGLAQGAAAEPLLVALGHADLAEGSYGAAQARLGAALDLQRRRLPPSHPTPAWTLDAWAYAVWRAGGDGAAFEGALEAAERIQAHLVASAQRLSERDALGYVAERTPGLALALLLAAEAGEEGAERVERAWGALIRARALVFGELRLRRALTRSARDPELETQTAALRTARERSATLAWRQAQGLDGGGLAQAQRVAREEAAAAELAWIERSGELRAGVDRGRAELADLRRALPTGWALVAYAQAHEVDACVALVLGPGGSARALELGSAAEIEGLAWAARDECRRPGSEAAWRRVGGALRERVWDRVEPLLAGAQVILLVLDGGLCLVDFAALPVGEAEYLIERAPPLHVLGSERDLIDEESAPPLLARDEQAPGLLAFGAPAFGTQALDPAVPPAGAARRTPFHALPESEREVRAVAEAWRGALGSRARVLVGPEATEAAFRELAPSAHIVHVATHAFAERPSEARATLRGIGLPLLTEEPSYRPPPFAGLSRLHLGRAALVLAGANGVPGTEGDDGVLLDEEIVGLDLEGVSLAVLSACDSGTGEVQRGEGVFGLRRAFLLAGARSVVASLWPVEDRAAAERMVDFHARLLGGAETPAEALRDASRAALARRRAEGLETHPWYWAGFVVAGRPARVR